MSSRFRRTPGGWYLADTAVVTAEAYLGEDVSVWFGAVIRGDVAPITVGPRTNVQDAAVVHCDKGIPNDVGADVTIGHAALVHGRRVGDGTLVGMGAKLLRETVVGRECLVAAGAIVPPRMVVPDRTLVAGVPARIVREVSDEDLVYLRMLPPHYVRLAQRYAAGEFHLDGRPLAEAT